MDASDTWNAEFPRIDVSTVPQKTPIARKRNPKRLSSKINTICRTCARCRTKKIKCDGIRPACTSCRSTDHECMYSQDARKLCRPTKAEVEALRNELEMFRQLFRERGLQGAALDLETDHRHLDRSCSNEAVGVEPSGVRPNGVRDVSRAEMHTPPQSASNESSRPGNVQAVDVASSTNSRIAYTIAGDGSIQVHGGTSHLRHPDPPGREGTPENITTKDEREAQIQHVKDRLFANTAFQRQREDTILKGCASFLQIKVELDGLDRDLAVHLLDIHFNRQHFAYLLTYRPAVTDSLIDDGPHVNKLLLNAIYYSSCLYSDRTVFRADPEDPDSMGENFYSRFKDLLVHEIDRPSLPTIAALLICGATLVSNGKQSAGWILCGIAYRMVVDLGLHLSITPRQDKTGVASRFTSVEIEMRTRIYWGAFLLDKFQSLYLGRPSGLRPTEARATKVLLDSYEELELWTPYVDPLATPTKTYQADFKSPRPVYAISTFQSLIPLAEIAYTVATTFYAIDSVQMPMEKLLKVKKDVRKALDFWFKDLPEHLRFNPATDPTPPPNQITPHVTFNTLIILIERPFLENGYLSFASSPASRATSEADCGDAAISIWHLVEAYKRAFTLRRSPYFLAYATYSAIMVMLHQKNSTMQDQECIRFFWFALVDFQKGCTKGLHKPLKILQSLMQRLDKSVTVLDKRRMAAPEDSRTQQNLVVGGPSDEVNMGDFAQDPAVDFWLNDISGTDELMQQTRNMESVWNNENWMADMLGSQDVFDESLFGLFTPGQHML